MLKPVYLRSFEREIEKAKKRGLDMFKIKDLMEKLINEKPLAAKHRNHKLKGNFIRPLSKLGSVDFRVLLSRFSIQI